MARGPPIWLDLAMKWLGFGPWLKEEISPLIQLYSRNLLLFFLLRRRETLPWSHDTKSNLARKKNLISLADKTDKMLTDRLFTNMTCFFHKRSKKKAFSYLSNKRAILQEFLSESISR